MQPFHPDALPSRAHPAFRRGGDRVGLTGPGSNRPLGVALLALCCALATANAMAQTASAPALKAVFIYNFAKFTEWPAEALPPNAPLVLCVAGDSRVLRALEEATRGRDLAGRPLVVRKVELHEPVTSCQLLYADELDTNQALQLLLRLRDSPVFSVSDLETFAQLGGSANLFSEDGRMRFAVNVDATQRARLHVSSKVLRLAKIVKDTPNVSRR